jgi:hypothetical protein
MRKLFALTALAVATATHAADMNTLTPEETAAGWQLLFDGKTLDGWRASDAPGTFSVKDGAIVVRGPRSHLFYVGPVQQHEFRNFEFKADVMTFAKANSGVYFHTKWQDAGWPNLGYEVQVNNSHTDPKRTAGLYNVQDNMEPPAKDGEWFTMQIVVNGKRITTAVNGKTISDYTEPEGVQRPADMAGRVLSSGTFALQGHDPKSKVFVKNIMVKPLP